MLFNLMSKTFKICKCPRLTSETVKITFLIDLFKVLLKLWIQNLENHAVRNVDLDKERAIIHLSIYLIVVIHWKLSPLKI